MNYCSECGDKLKSLPTDAAWTHKDWCEPCSVIYVTSVGDAMGGSRDVVEKISTKEKEVYINDKLGERFPWSQFPPRKSL